MKPLTESQKQAAEALIAGHSIAAVAIERGVSRRTIENWRSMPAFKEFCEKIHKECEKSDTKSIAETLQRLRSKAFAKIEQILDSEDISLKTQLQAASLVLKIQADSEKTQAKMQGAAEGEKLANFRARQKMIKFMSEVSTAISDAFPAGNIEFLESLKAIPDIDPRTSIQVAKAYHQAFRDVSLLAENSKIQELSKFYSSLDEEFKKPKYEDIRDRIYDAFELAISGIDDDE
jgi:Zn-dependent M16 (insulinase) family peptidase